jgi:hypothetical protein
MPVREYIGRAKYIAESEFDNAFIKIEAKLDEQINSLIMKEAELDAKRI